MSKRRKHWCNLKGVEKNLTISYVIKSIDYLESEIKRFHDSIAHEKTKNNPSISMIQSWADCIKNTAVLIHNMRLLVDVIEHPNGILYAACRILHHKDISEDIYKIASGIERQGNNSWYITKCGLPPIMQDADELIKLADPE